MALRVAIMYECRHRHKIERTIVDDGTDVVKAVAAAKDPIGSQDPRRRVVGRRIQMARSRRKTKKRLSRPGCGDAITGVVHLPPVCRPTASPRPQRRS
jgi:hypothetical protein